MSRAKALVVDDEPDILELVRMTLARMDIGACCVATLAEARDALLAERFDLCLTDMRLPDGDGIDLVRLVAEHYPEMPIAMVTAYGNMDRAVTAMKAGAFDFVSKPLDLRVLRELTESALRLRQTTHPVADPVDHGRDAPAARLIGESSPMRHLRQLIAKLARNQAPVFINGESGTGKELVASLIHQLGPRADGPFVPVNCGAIPNDLVESELFGHRRGSFTGAISDKPGLFQAASGGTLFLDEIADLPLPMQVKLLRAIQEKSVRPVGAAHEVPVDVRIISASHRDLDAQVARGAFRQDLYYRINVIDLRIPPLRARAGDIPLLANRLLGRIAAEAGNPVRALSPAALAKLERYHFPGNVRELENILERAVALCEHPVLTEDDLHLPHFDVPHAQDRHQTEPKTTAKPDVGTSLAERLAAIERQALVAASAAATGDVATMANNLRISPRSLRFRLRRAGFDLPGGAGDAAP